MKLRAAVILARKLSLSSRILNMRCLCSRAFSRSTSMLLICKMKTFYFNFLTLKCTSPVGEVFILSTNELPTLGKHLHTTLYNIGKQMFTVLWSYPLLLLQLPQFHVFDTLLLICLLDKRDLFKALRSLKIINLWQKKRELKQDSCTGKRFFFFFLFNLPSFPGFSGAPAAPSSPSLAAPPVWPWWNRDPAPQGPAKKIKH